MTGDWWDMDLDQLDRNMLDGFFSDNQKASMINGKLGDLYNCSGKIIIEVFFLYSAQYYRAQIILFG
jgi:hypothetical protein